MSIMIYHSVAKKEVKPDIVELTIYLKVQADTVKEAINKINEDRNIAKTYITGKKSYRPDSYHQQNINIVKRTFTEYYYTQLNGEEISQSEYDELDQTQKLNYMRRSREHFICYETTLILTAVLNYGETVVEDLMNIFNMCTEKEFKCDYKHTVSDELNKSTNQELYSVCINQGVSEVQNIANKLTFLENPKVKLIEVLDPATTSRYGQLGVGMVSESALKFDSAGIDSAYEPEQIIMPELLEELFNNNIELTKSLDMKLEF